MTTHASEFRTTPVASPVRIRARARLWAAWLLWPALAIAAIVTAIDVANAIRNSPTASPFLKANADQIGALAIAVESGGDTTAYNGSCCYGVLQRNTANIIASGYTASQYRYASLQDQINAWANIESQALRDPVIQQLANMSTFDGHPVDASMLIACVQLGQGNCRTMINSGRCNGFADGNGTTICSMAAQMNAAIAGTGSGSGTGAGTGAGHTGGGTYVPGPSLSPDDAFVRGSGISQRSVSDNIKLILAAFVLIWTAWVALGTWGLFTDGKAALPDMTQKITRSLVIVMLVVWLVN